MFNFTITESQQQIFKNQTIDFFPKKIKSCKGETLLGKYHHNVTYIVAEEMEKGIRGGACVFKNELRNIQEDVKELVTTLAQNNGYVWECSCIYIETSSQYPLPGTPESQYFSQSFYRGLYEGFVNFGKRREVGYVILKLAAEVYASTKKFGLWPYVVELRPENSPDGLFHGILPLTGSQYEAYQKTWDALDKYLPTFPNSHI